jgi:hypothetical protein
VGGEFLKCTEFSGFLSVPQVERLRRKYYVDIRRLPLPIRKVAVSFESICAEQSAVHLRQPHPNVNFLDVNARDSRYRAIAASTPFILAVANLVIATVIYAGVFHGKTPLPMDLLLTSPAFEGISTAGVEGHSANLGDLAVQIYPWRIWAADALRHGDLPLWNPLILAGTPFLANAQSAIFYPPNWLFTMMPGPQAWGVLFILNTAAAGWFAALLIRRIGAEPAAAFAGGVCAARRCPCAHRHSAELSRLSCGTTS